MSLDALLTRQFINIMGVIVDEFRLSVSKDGWKVRAVDPANVALIDIDLPKDSFLSYEFGETDTWTSSIDGHATGVLEENILVGIDVDKIKEFFGGMHEAEIVLDEELHEPVEFAFSRATGKYANRYQLELKQGMFSRTMLLLPESDIRRSPKIPALGGLDYCLQLNTCEFQRIVKKASKVSDYIRLGFRREEGSVTFTASTVDSEDFPWDATTQIHNWQALSEGARTSSSSLYSLDDLCDITEKIPSEKVWLHLGHDYPCTLSFVLGRTGQGTYFQAPRIESEEYV